MTNCLSPTAICVWGSLTGQDRVAATAITRVDLRRLDSGACASTNLRPGCLPRSSTVLSPPWMSQPVQVRRFVEPLAARATSSHARRRHTLNGVSLSGTQSRHSAARCPRLRRAEHGHVAVRTRVRGRGPPSLSNVRLDDRRPQGYGLLLPHRAPDRVRRAAEVRWTGQPLGGTRRAAGPPCPG
jgi:hypothetical protein